MLKVTIFILTFFMLYTHPAHAMQPCRANELTKKQAMERFDNIVVIKVKSSLDETDWFSKQYKEKNKGNPEEQKKFEEIFLAYVTYKATVLENFKGSLKGDIDLAEMRHAFSSYNGTLVTGFYYIIGLNNRTDEDTDFVPENIIIMPGCSTISVGLNKFYSEFLDKVEEYRK